MDIGRSLILVGFSRIFRLVELGRLFKYRVDVSRILRLVNLSRFFKF